MIIVSDIESIKPALDIVHQFSEVAGPRLNMDKVEGIWLGPLKDTMPDNYCNVVWTKEAVRCLGIYIGHNKEQCIQRNWNDKFANVKNLLSQWKRRNLTILGKV